MTFRHSPSVASDTLRRWLILALVGLGLAAGAAAATSLSTSHATHATISGASDDGVAAPLSRSWA